MCSNYFRSDGPMSPRSSFFLRPSMPLLSSFLSLRAAPSPPAKSVRRLSLSFRLFLSAPIRLFSPGIGGCDIRVATSCRFARTLIAHALNIGFPLEAAFVVNAANSTRRIDFLVRKTLRSCRRNTLVRVQDSLVSWQVRGANVLRPLGHNNHWLTQWPIARHHSASAVGCGGNNTYGCVVRL